MREEPTTAENKAAGTYAAPLTSLDWVNLATMWGLVAMGLCLMDSCQFDDLAVVRSVYTEAINHDPASTYILTGNQIPVPSRIIQICDAWVAMTSERSYQPSIPREDAVTKLREGAGTQFDEQLVQRFIKSLGEMGA